MKKVDPKKHKASKEHGTDDEMEEEEEEKGIILYLTFSLSFFSVQQKTTPKKVKDVPQFPLRSTV